MSESKSQMPNFESLEALAEFVEINDMADYLDAMPEVECEVNIQRRTLAVSVDSELMKKLTAAARLRHVPVETLIRSWLEEKVAQAA
jgi:hypothetical protein